MFRRNSIFILVVLLTLVIAACSQTAGEQTASNVESAEKEVKWGYDGAGAPENWGDLKTDYELCKTGKEQSPIDLTSASASDLENISFSYSDSAVNILNNGHTIQVNYDEGSTATINGQTYNLLQFHFHSPSEHAIDGNLFPAEMHLVHADADGNLAVVGVMIAEGAENAAYAPVWSNLPKDISDPTATGMTVNATDLLPSKQTIYRYNGSLTTPPCSEGVLWSVIEQPIEMSAEQIKAFTDIFEISNRPVQTLNSRELFFDSTP